MPRVFLVQLHAIRTLCLLFFIEPGHGSFQPLLLLSNSGSESRQSLLFIGGSDWESRNGSSLAPQIQEGPGVVGSGSEPRTLTLHSVTPTH
jgi:hypothetical protein